MTNVFNVNLIDFYNLEYYIAFYLMNGFFISIHNQYFNLNFQFHHQTMMESEKPIELNNRK